MVSLKNNLSEIVGKAFEAQNLPAELGAVKKSDRPDLCQFQCNGALSAAKIAKKSPRLIAQTIVDELKGASEIKDISIAGAGFININASNEFISKALTESDDERCGIKKTKNGTIIVDYVGANVAKAMHVGHLRPSIIGDSIKRIMKFAGYNAVGDVHLGDFGLQMGQIISELEETHPNWGYFSNDAQIPQNPPFTYQELEEIYPKASAACKQSAKRLDKARKATAKLQKGDAGYTALWRHFVELSKQDIKRNLDALNISPEIWKGESDSQPSINPLADELTEKDLLVKSEGAMVIPVSQDDDKKPMPPLMYAKSDGSATYATTDAATMYDRIGAYKDLKKIIYVADARQNLHFEQLFRAMKKGGYAKNIDLLSIGFGTMNGKDGKPFKTRSGGLPRFDELMGQTINRAHERLGEAGIKDDDELARKIMMATLKFADLSNPPQADYIFDLDKMTAFEGRSGPYVLYQAVRAKAIINKVGKPDKIAYSINGQNDRALALILLQWDDAFDAALRAPSPHFIAEHAYNLAQEFSRFYAACHIASEKNMDIKNAQISLVVMVEKQLSLALDLLGIMVPEKM